MRSTVWSLTLGVTLVGASVASAGPVPGVRRPQAMSLFAGATQVFEVNRLQCNLASNGEVCSANGSPVGGGGFWPRGTVDQYIFNSGLELAGVIPASAGFPWAGDTIGAFFFDARGDQRMGDPLTGIYYSINPSDAAAWPAAGQALDTALYNSVLIGRNQVSQGDAFVRYWEGNPTFLSGRTHPMGIMVDERAMAWNYPTGNEDIVYFVFTFYNVTASNAAAYTNATIPASLQAGIAAQGAEFQRINEARFGVNIPDGGYPIADLYAAFGMDADVAVFSQNYSTAILPYNIGMTYTGTFLPEVGWTFPSEIFGAPFYPGPGFVGVKYLRSPKNLAGAEVGLTMFSTQVNSATGFPDPRGVNQLFRYLSGFVGPTDNPCSPFSDPAVARARRLCFMGQQQGDARFYQSSGPFVLPPGEARTIVVAYIHAAPTDAVAPLAGGDVKPQIPFTGDSIFLDANRVRTIERIAGWISHNDDDGNSVITEDEVVTVPRSLLNKAAVAQAVFNNKFLLPFSPEAPTFFLVPSDNQVTVLWQPSASETTGDPFYAVASNGASPLFDANFREFDVEGYRIYRGRASSELQLVAQFDYAGTTFVDYTGAVEYPDNDGDGLIECAPELGATQDCPSFPFETDISGNLVQVPAGGRVLLANGGVLVLRADTAGVGFPALENTGVPFAYVDTDVRNSFTYFYSVTAFDVNSFTSGPTSLESPLVTKRVTPRKSVPNQSVAELSFAVYGDDGVALNPSAPAGWAPDAATGRFPGPPPPTGSIAATFAPLVPQLLPQMSLTALVDSVIPRTDQDGRCPASNIQGICFEFFISYILGTDTLRVRTTPFWPIWNGFGEPVVSSATLGGRPVPADSVSSARFGIPAGSAQFNAAMQGSLRQYVQFSAHEGQGGRRLLASVSPGGSRWFAGANETVDHPTYSIRVGSLPGVDTIFAPLSHIDPNPLVAGVQVYSPLWADGGGNSVQTNLQCQAYVIAATGRQADIRLTWGAAGTVASIRDITHHVNVPFHAIPQAGYGFFPLDANGNGKIDWRDFDRMEGVAQSNAHLGFCAGADPGFASRARLVAQPAIGPLSTNAASPDGTLAGMVTTGTGFGLMLNGQVFFFQLTGGTPPAAGTVWTLRSYAGMVSATSNAATTTPGGYTYTPVTSSPAIPGLRVIFSVPQRTGATAEAADALANVHTVPDPYYVANALEFSANNKVLKFVNLPTQAIIRIYSVSGVLVNVITHNDAGLGAEATWNLRNRNNQLVASGVYFYHVETPAGNTKVGRLTVVNFAP